MDRVLVTGADGLLGSTLVPVLSELGFSVTAVGGRHAATQATDLADGAAARALLERLSPEVIVNLAAATSVDACERDPRLAFAANTAVVGHITQWMASQSRSSHLVQVSTDQVYDGPGPHVEDEVCPINYYAWSKYAGELLAGRVSSTVIRTNLFGRSRAPHRSSISDWVVASLRAGRQITVFKDVLFAPVSLETLSKAIGAIIRHPQVGTFNLGSSGGMSKAEFAFRLAEAIGLPTSAMIVGTSADLALAARRPHDMRMDCSRFERCFGASLPSLEQEIAAVKECYVN